MSCPLFETLSGKSSQPAPLWMMRQAGRYLPEYRKTRELAGSFWKMCSTPALAAEVTLQPIRRFGLDAAILFSDILVVPAALGMTVQFEEGGPRMVPIASQSNLRGTREMWNDSLAPVYEALALVRAGLPRGVALLGFAGAPWTLATYMAAGRGGDEQKAAKLWGYRDPVGFSGLLERVGDCVAHHLIGQLKAGADAVQIFDSWASGLPAAAFTRWVVSPTRRIVDIVRAAVPKAKIIGFPRGATLTGYAQYAHETGVDAISLDTGVPMDWATNALSTVLQGNLDPIALVAGGMALEEGVRSILGSTRGRPFIFNLGHGILPETPIAHVEELIRLVRA